MGRGRKSSASLSAGNRAPRGGAGAKERRALRDAAPSDREDARGSVGRDARRVLTLTKSSMMGSLSSSFSPFSGIDNAMARSAGLHRRW